MIDPGKAVALVTSLLANLPSERAREFAAVLDKLNKNPHRDELVRLLNKVLSSSNPQRRLERALVVRAAKEAIDR